MKPILCLGDACIDLIIPYAAALKAKSGESIGSAVPEVMPASGGSVANTACAAARLDAPVLFAGTCGRDAYGMLLKRELEAEGIQTTYLRMDDRLPTQLVLLVLNERGDRTAFACPAHGGSQHAIPDDQLPDDIADRIGWLHVSGMMLREEPAASTQLRCMKACFEAGVPVSLDINARIESLGDPVFYRNLMAAKSYCTVIFGSSVDEIPLLGENRDSETAAAQLAANGTAVIARSGDQGAVLYRNDQRIHVPAFHVSVADTVGAGDTFDGAYIAARMHGLAPADAMREANAAAAICVSRTGGRSGPTRIELDAFLKSHTV